MRGVLSIVKKVLILSCGTGEGHNSAAHAIEDALSDRNIEFEMIDPISFRSESAQKRVASLYNNMIRKTPRIFGVVYKIGSIFEKTRITSPVYYANCLYAEKLKEYIRANSFDAVISILPTESISASIIIELKTKSAACGAPSLT